MALTVASVQPGSPADRGGVLPGDIVAAVNEHPVIDGLGFRFHLSGREGVLALVRAGVNVEARLVRSEDDDAGVDFADELGDGIHTCNNRCVFCFIHQMPKRMRRSLYLMDDDYRLSFTHGNYITLTNVGDAEFARILEERLSPLYVSVHATDPRLRGRLLGKREPAPILPRLRALAQGRIDVHAQVVLCPGLNDGPDLVQTIAELAQLHPRASGLRSGVLSVAVVPVGLTRFRERLTPLQRTDAQYADAMIGAVRRTALSLRRSLATRFVWLSDEWYHLAGRPIPGARHYEDFPQLEDGVGTIRLFVDEARSVARRLPAEAPAPVRCTLVTAELPAEVIIRYAERLSQVSGVTADVCIVRNNHFGGGINIAGLLTGEDIRDALVGHGPNPLVFVPDICLTDEGLFLDDMSIEDLRTAACLDVRSVRPRPRALATALGLV